MTTMPELDTFSTRTNFVDKDVMGKTKDIQQSNISDDLECDDKRNVNDSMSDEEIGPIGAPKKRTQHFSDSDSDIDNVSKLVDSPGEKVNSGQQFMEPNLHSSSPIEIKMTRIRRMKSSDSENGSSDKGADCEDRVAIRKSLRREDKESTLKHKFKSLLSHKNTLKISSEDEDTTKPYHSNSEHSGDEFSCLKIKQKMKSSANTMKVLCDSDTSDEEDISQAISYKRKSKPKMTKSTSPKPIRMTAKLAMENMQKIRSESNRMLREKGVSLPYHRPKALTLKDILNRRKPAVSSDGKTLPIKMNEEQLRQYAMLLEQRQKEVIELCKSDTEEEDKEDEPKNETNETNRVTNESNEKVTKETTNEIPTMELISDHKEIGTNIKHCVGDNDENINEKLPESSEHAETAMETDFSNKSVTDAIDEIDDECLELEDNTLLKNKAAEESQNISLHYNSEKIIVNGTDGQAQNEEAEIEENDDFSDCDINMDEIDKIIQEAEINCSKTNGPKPVPKLTGAPGTLINFDEEETVSRKLSGVELLKERFSFFAKIKTVEDMEKDREKKFKPGTQHLKLKQELEQQISEQRSLEWEKRLQEEKQLKSEVNGENDEDDIEKLESKMEEIGKDEIDNESSESEEELIENDVVLEDKPMKRNPMFDDEAEVSGDENCYANDGDVENDESDEGDDSSSESDDADDDTKPRKGRILKAFEDSDDEKENEAAIDNPYKVDIKAFEVGNDVNLSQSQDDELPLGQINKSSDDLFTTQSTEPESAIINNTNENIVELSTPIICLSNPDLSKMIKIDINPDNMNVCGTQSDDAVMEHIAGMCSGSFSQNLVTSQMFKQSTQSQEFGDDIADMCTGKFYDNQFVSQEISSQVTESEDKTQDLEKAASLIDDENISRSEENVTDNVSNSNTANSNKENTILNSILDELNDLDDRPKQNRYFASDVQSKELKKKFVIESDDEIDNTSPKKIKKRKKKKAEQRALHISDDEEEITDVESDIEEEDGRVVEYDSEENEIEVVQPKTKPQKKGIRDFFENEAELTSEDEWIGSGDEDERDLDRMEREEGDDDTFNQGQLRRELGQIHMRDVLDQDKREVRMIQELLFEDGDLGDGHRQRKFRWRNADGEEETGTYPEEFTDTQEDEFESEEQWRKERHEREMFIRQMHKKDENEKNISLNRSAIIKANLSSRNVSSPVTESKTTKAADTLVPEKKITKDIPSPKKGFTIFQQNYHTSLLTRGRGALARLAALATPLADDDAPRNISNNRGNFVFAAITPNDESKVTTKRKAEIIHTPRLIKKLKTEDRNIRKPSLFDHINI